MKHSYSKETLEMFFLSVCVCVCVCVCLMALCLGQRGSGVTIFVLSLNEAKPDWLFIYVMKLLYQAMKTKCVV